MEGLPEPEHSAEVSKTLVVELVWEEDLREVAETAAGDLEVTAEEPRRPHAEWEAVHVVEV